jgi:hypothetical protein
MADQMPSRALVRLAFEGELDDRGEYEMQARGYRSHVWAELNDGSRHRLTFYDPTRLEQTLADEERDGRPFFAEPGLVILKEVTRSSMEMAARILAEEGYFG